MTEKVYIIGITVAAGVIIFLLLLLKFGKGKITANDGDEKQQENGGDVNVRCIIFT